LEVNELKKIAVIGAGIAGIVCARTLVQAGHQVQVFEKSRGFGGRMATRKTPMGTFDHGAPYFEVSDPRFKKALAICSEVTAAWKGPANATIATPTMSALVGEWAKPLLLANGLKSQGSSVALDTLVTSFHRDLGNASKWQIQSTKEGIEQPTLAGFDAIVLAIPNVQASALLAKAEQTHLQQIAQTAQMSPCWAMMLVYEGELSKQDQKLVKDFTGKRYKDSPVAWIGRELSKQSRTGPERFVVHASPEWSEQNLEADEAFVLTELLVQFAKLTGIYVPPSSKRAHRWRYAHVAKPAQSAKTQSFVWDNKSVIGMCGDWCSGHSVQDAFVSGLELALHIAKRESLTIRFVPAQISDLEQLVQIRTVAMRPSLEAVGRFDADRVRQRLINNYFPEYTQLICLVDKVIGFYTLRPVDGQLLLDHLYIEPESQGLGVGGITLNRLFAMASNESKTIRVGALIGSDSNRFYTANGFSLVSSGEFDHYYERSWS
jgi:renalase